MLLDLKKLSTQAIESTTTSTKMRLSEHAQSMVFQLFTKNVYSNPIGTVVREITSNCFDSHVEAGVNSPVIIKLSVDKETNSKHISFIDYGVGMSPERIYDIYGVYFESTKRVDNEQIGGFGIGGKTPLAYKRTTGSGDSEYDNSFYVITNYNGTRYYYCMYEGSDSPVIAPLHEEPTTEHNGTEVRIPVLDKDLNKFAQELLKQLYYFENVIFEGFEDDYRFNNVVNNYQIIKGNAFLFRGTNYSNYIHVCLGKVAYPIDYNVLGLDSDNYRLSIALKLDVGDIGVTVSRETLDYSDTTVKILKKKLEEAKEEIKQMLIKQYEDIVTLEDYFNVKTSFGTLLFKNGMGLATGHLIKLTDLPFNNFEYNLFKMPTDKQLFKIFFDVATYGNKPAKKKNTELQYGYGDIKHSDNIFYIEDVFERKPIKQAYLKSRNGLFHVIERKDLTDPIHKEALSSLFSIEIKHYYAGNVLCDEVKEIIAMQDEFFSMIEEYCPNYNDLIVPDAFIQSRKRGRNIMSDELKKTTIPVKFGCGNRSRTTLKALMDFKGYIFYGNSSDSRLFKAAVDVYEMLFDENRIIHNYDERDNVFYTKSHYWSTGKISEKIEKIIFIQISDVNTKYMKYCPKAFHITKFYDKVGYRKLDIVQNYLQSENIIDRYNQIPNIYVSDLMGCVSYAWKLKIVSLRNKISILRQNSGVLNNLTSNQRDVIRQYYFNKLSHKEDKVIVRDIKEFLGLAKANADVLGYIDYYSSYGSNPPATLVDILQKVLIF